MAKLFQVFDATTVDPTQGGGGNLPVGRHPVVIVANEVAATKDNSGGYLALTLEIIDGPNKGSRGVVRINLYNQSAQAVDIANRQFSALCHVTNQFRVDDVDVLQNIPFMVDVELQRDPEAAKKGYTEVKKFLYLDGSEPGKKGNTATAQQQQQQQNNGGQWNNQPQGNNAQWGNGQQQQQQSQPQGNGGWNAQQQQQQQNNGGGENRPAWAR